jgi:hypothetical protein
MACSVSIYNGQRFETSGSTSGSDAAAPPWRGKSEEANNNEPASSRGGQRGPVPGVMLQCGIRENPGSATINRNSFSQPCLHNIRPGSARRPRARPILSAFLVFDQCNILHRQWFFNGRINFRFRLGESKCHHGLCDFMLRSRRRNERQRYGRCFVFN